MSMYTARAYLLVHSIINSATNDGLSSQHNRDVKVSLKTKCKPLDKTEV
jgi:hypothetical protein